MDAQPAPDSVLRHFETGRPRPFVAGRLDLGLNARSMVALGWGRPHWLWVGAVGVSNFTPSNASQAGGFQLGAPFGELSLQARRVAAYQHRFLSPRSEFVEGDLTAGDLKVAHYGMLEASLTALIPARVGVVYINVWLDRLLAVPTDTYVYDEISRSVVRGPWVGVEQLSFLFFITHNHYHHRLGPLSEHLWSDRSSADVVEARCSLLGPAHESHQYLCSPTPPNPFIHPTPWALVVGRWRHSLPALRLDISGLAGAMTIALEGPQGGRETRSAIVEQPCDGVRIEGDVRDLRMTRSNAE